jgi:3-oxoacyl-[acyl-carrier protein] reductase
VIVNMSSISARGNAGQSAYAAAKAGVEALTRSWAKELGPLGLRFVAVAPGFIDTPSTRAALSVEILEELKQKTPLRRLGEVANVALAVIYALENDLLTGTVLDVDGGLTI